jgi:hypothetical protein
MTPRFLALQGPNFFSFWRNSCLHFSLLVAVLFTAVAPLVGVARKILMAGTKFSDTSMAGPLGVLPAGPATATTGVGGVDSGSLGGAAGRSGSGYHRSWRRRWRAPWGCCRQVQQRPPPELETLMAGPLASMAI